MRLTSDSAFSLAIQVIHLVKSDKLYSPQDIGLERKSGGSGSSPVTRLLGQTPSCMLAQALVPAAFRGLGKPRSSQSVTQQFYLLGGTEYFAGACCHIHSPTACP